MWADYYEKYRGTPKFGMSEEDKLNAQARLEGLKNAYLMNMMGARLGTQQDIANKRFQTQKDVARINQTVNAGKQGATLDEDNNLIPAASPMPVAAATIAKDTSIADVNKSRKTQIDTVNDITKKAVSGGADDSNLVLSGVGPRGASFTNMDVVGQKDVMKEEAQAYKLQNQKVDAAIHAHTLLDAGFDPKTGRYDISKIPLSELGTAAANVITNDPGTDARTREEMRVKSLQGDTMGILSYITGKPMNVMTSENANMLSDIFERQGSLSEDLRNQHAQSVGSKNMGNSFKQYLSTSPSYGYRQKQKITGLSQATSGVSIPAFNSLSELQAANLPKGTRVKVGNQTGVWGE